MSSKTILTKEQFKEKSKSQCITLFTSDNFIVYFDRGPYGFYLVTAALFDDDGHQIVGFTTTINYTLDGAYAMYLKLSNHQ